MGRSVSSPSGAVILSFLAVSIGYEEESHYFEWGEFLSDLRELLTEKYPSLSECDKWIGREDHAILSNRYAYIGVSEYCGMVCVWGAVKDSSEYPELAEQWLNSISAGFHKHMAARYCSMVYNRIGFMSNGQGVYIGAWA